jgi:pimeloyl-ACP methyl ester carboxylesterase
MTRATGLASLSAAAHKRIMTEAETVEIVPPSFLDRAEGARLAYRFTMGPGPLLVFLPGYRSDMEGGKATAVFARAQALGHACLLFDYSGCGSSAGNFEDGTLDIWRDDVLALIDHVWPQGQVVPIGSSMGGWLALLIAQRLGARTAGLVGIASAPDFTDWGFSEEQKAALAKDGHIVEPSDYGEGVVTTLGFWRSGEANRLLDKPIPLSCPVRLLHGQADPVVPWEIATRLAAHLHSPDVQTLLVKDGDHRLSRDGDIALLHGLIEGLLEHP